MALPARQLQRGFSLAELAIVLALIAMITPLMFDSFAAWNRWKNRIDTQRKLADVRQALTAAYRDGIATAEADADAKLTLPTGVIPIVPADGSGRCLSTDTTLSPIGPYSTQSPATLYRDGGGAPMCIFVSPRQSRQESGITLYYHSVAVVAPGPNGVLEATTDCTTQFDNAGNLHLCGDDEGVVMDGAAIAHDALQATLQRLQKIAAAYQAYAASRFQVSTARDVGIDYFAATGPSADRWDNGGNMPSTGCQGFKPLIAATTPSPHDVLGLSPLDVTDAYGQTITVDNCSPAVRSPDNPTSTQQLPPYSALLRTTLPGGGTLDQSVIGIF